MQWRLTIKITAYCWYHLHQSLPLKLSGFRIKSASSRWEGKLIPAAFVRTNNCLSSVLSCLSTFQLFHCSLGHEMAGGAARRSFDSLCIRRTSWVNRNREENEILMVPWTRNEQWKEDRPRRGGTVEERKVCPFHLRQGTRTNRKSRALDLSSISVPSNSQWIKDFKFDVRLAQL